MIIQAKGTREGAFTDTAGKQFISCVSFFMFLQATSLELSHLVQTNDLQIEQAKDFLPLWVFIYSFRLKDKGTREEAFTDSTGNLSHVWVLIWLFRWRARENELSQIVQANGFSPVWVLLCSFRLPAWEKELSQKVQTNNFSPVWVLICLLRCPAREKELSQIVQRKYFSPVWVLLCSISSPAWEKELSQKVQAKGFTPVWVLLCMISLLGVRNLLSQVQHLCSMAVSGRVITGVLDTGSKRIIFNFHFQDLVVLNLIICSFCSHFFFLYSVCVFIPSLFEEHWASK